MSFGCVAPRHAAPTDTQLMAENSLVWWRNEFAIDVTNMLQSNNGNNTKMDMSALSVSLTVCGCVYRQLNEQPMLATNTAAATKAVYEFQ